MSTILAIAKKDLRLMSRDRMGMFFIIAFPIIMGIFFGLVNKSISSGEGGMQKIRLALIDDDNSAMSHAFAKALVASGHVEIVKDTASVADASTKVRKGDLAAFIELPAGFGKTAGIMWMAGPAIRLGVDPSRGAESGMLNGYIMEAMGRLIQQRFTDFNSMRPIIDQSIKDFKTSADMSPALKSSLVAMMGQLDIFLDTAQKASSTQATETGDEDTSTFGPKGGFQLARIESVDVTQQPSAAQPVDPTKASVDELVKKIHSSWDISFPSAILWGVLGCAAGFAVTMVREQTQGTMFRLQVAPISIARILAGKGLACFTAVLFVNAAMIALGLALGLRPGSYPLLMLAVVSLGICFVGVMMLMSVVGRSEEAVAGASWGVNVTMAMFGGGMIPLLFMPSWMQSISSASPVKWGVLALEGAIWRGYSFSEMLEPCGILIGIGVVAMILGTRMLKSRLV